MSQTTKIRIRRDLADRAAATASAAGFSTVEEFIEQAIERALAVSGPDAGDPGGADRAEIERRLKGLGYM